MLKVSGQWVSPAEVIGIAEGDGLIKPQVFVILKDGVEPTEALANALLQYVKTSLQPVKFPRWKECLPDLPKTAIGKIQRYRRC